MWEAFFSLSIFYASDLGNGKSASRMFYLSSECHASLRTALVSYGDMSCLFENFASQ